MTWKKAIEVKVLINGTAAQEYNDDNEESNGPNTVTRYIEAVSGAEFEVYYEIKPSFRFPSQHLVFEISIDGKVLDCDIISKEHPRGGIPTRKGSLEGISRSDGETWSLERFRFSDIKIRDDPTQNANTDLKAEAAKIGIITLKVHRKRKGVYYKPGTKGSGHGWDDLTELGMLPEKALKGKALSHCTSLGSPQFTSSKGMWLGCEYLDGKDKPFAVFNFKYRSRKALQDLHIIERTQAPVPLEERPIEQLTGEEARELLRRQRERQASTDAQVKAEIRPERGIKREYENDEEYSALLDSARANKVPRVFEEGEVINLLED